MLTLGFPSGLLFDMMMRGGPLPERFEGLGRALVNPGHLEFEPEEAVVIREWLEQESDEVIDGEARDAAVDLVNEALRQAELCPSCGGAFIVSDQQGDPRCGRCGEAPEY